MVKFGPSGNDIKFYEDGNKSSIDAPKWLSEMGLSAYEISFGRGIRLSDKTAEIIGRKAKENNVEISVHAPYYINLANMQSLEKNYQYIKKSLELLFIMGGNRLVVHIGSQMELERSVAIANCRKNLSYVVERLHKEGIDNYFLCIETMGKYSQIGNIDEICDLCKVDKRIIPTVDFGHINCTSQGVMNIDRIFEMLKDFDTVHYHISFIEFSVKGEIKHLTFADTKYAFDLAKIIENIKRRNKDDTVICESADIMAQDSVKLLDFYLQ